MIKPIYQPSFFLLIISLCCISCNSSEDQNIVKQKRSINKNFDLQGHRGARGLYPENSIMGFIMAVDMGVKTLELDVVISKDKKIVVSHEPWISHEICTKKSGEVISEDEEINYNMYQMTYEEIRKFDCGTKEHPRFPNQIKAITYKPLLRHVVEVVETFTAARFLEPMRYNIETKSLPEGDNIFHPEPEEFCKILYDELKRLNVLDRVTIQSFDVRTLQAFRNYYPQTKLVLLVENKMSFEENIKSLGFNPHIYSPNYHLVDDELVSKCHNNNIKLIPWTVNTEDQMEKLVQMGVDGLITDYPDIALTLRD